MTANLNPVEQYILETLNQHGFDKLKPEDQKNYLQQFVAEGEKRLGLAVAPYLPEKSNSELNELMESESTPEQWLKFYQKYVPSYEDLVKSTLDNYIKEIANAFGL